MAQLSFDAIGEVRQLLKFRSEKFTRGGGLYNEPQQILGERGGESGLF